MNKIIISGWVLSKERRMTGIPRCMVEFLRGLDDLLEKEKDIKVEYVCPKNAPHYLFDPKTLKNITFTEISNCSRKLLWKIYDLPKYAKKTNSKVLFLNPEYTLCKDFIVCVYDLRPLILRTDNFVFRTIYRRQIKNIKMRASSIIVNSEFIKDSIEQIIGDKKKLYVVPLGWEHFKRIDEDSKIIQKLNLKNGEYYFSLGSLAPHKNIAWVVNYARQHPSDYFVISGERNPKYWKNTQYDTLKNVIFTGYLTDEEIKSLVIHSKAFIQPSLYEGFGLPPLEAISCNTKVALSDIEVFREIFSNHAVFFNPNNFDVNLDELLKRNFKNQQQILKKYSWAKSIECLMKILERN